MSNTRLFLSVIPTTATHLYAVIALLFMVAYMPCTVQSASLRDTLPPTLVSAEHMMQPAQATDIGTIILQDFRHALNDAGMYFTAPLRFQAKDWLLAAGTLGASASLLPLDESINSVMLRNRSAAGGTSVVGTAAEIGRLYGELWVSGSIGAGLYLVGLAAQNRDVRVTGRLALEALVFGGALNITLKALFGRSRPYLEEGALAFRPVQITDSRMAFPSGHTTVAFAMSAVLAERIGNPWIGAGLYALAGLTAVSRLYHTQHWASDVVLGAAIGAGAGLLVTHLERQRINAVSTGQQVLIYPTLTGLGVTVYFAGR